MPLARSAPPSHRTGTRNGSRGCPQPAGGRRNHATSNPSATKFTAIADPPKLRNGVTTPVSGITPRMPAPITSAGIESVSTIASARKKP